MFCVSIEISAGFVLLLGLCILAHNKALCKEYDVTYNCTSQHFGSYVAQIPAKADALHAHEQHACHAASEQHGTSKGCGVADKWP